MKKIVSVAVVLLALAPVALALAAASVSSQRVTAALSPRAEVPTPKGAAKATGFFSGTLLVRTKDAKLTWKLSFVHLTGQARSARIYLGNPGVVGKVIIALCAPCASRSGGTSLLNKAVVKELRAGQTYVNIRTKKNPAGEIRGQVRVRG